VTGGLPSEDTDLLLGRFSAAFLPRPPTRIAVAVSGGGDSMALLHMALRLRGHLGWSVAAVTVDHGLRAESAAEAAGVAAFCQGQGILHHILRWQGPEARGNLMDQARRARFSLIADWARACDIGDVLLGHTADDNAESFLMNLARQAGIDGLSGMRSGWSENGIVWHRPLLTLRRADLRAYLTRNAVAWIDDPSNDNERFTRVKARRALEALAPLGITAEKLGATIGNLAEARQVLRRATACAAEAHISENGGALSMAPEALVGLDAEISRRLLSGIIRWMGGAGYAPRGSQLDTLLKALTRGESAQLGGVRFRQSRGRVEIAREARAVMGAVPFGALWDHRWRVLGPALPGLEIGALGAAGLQACPDGRRHGSRAALTVTPALWAENRLIAAPFAGMAGPYRAELTQPLVQFILSH
jgi:tRNA(Ile)-lysidine synthase